MGRTSDPGFGDGGRFAGGDREGFSWSANGGTAKDDGPAVAGFDPKSSGWDVSGEADPLAPTVGNYTAPHVITGAPPGITISKAAFAGDGIVIEIDVFRPPEFAVEMSGSTTALQPRVTAPAEAVAATAPDPSGRRVASHEAREMRNAREEGRQARPAAESIVVAPPPTAAADRSAPAKAPGTSASTPHEAASPVAPQAATDSAAATSSRSLFDPATVARAANVIVGIARAVEAASIGPIVSEQVATAVADTAAAATLGEVVAQRAAEGAGAAASGLLHLPTGPVVFLGLAPASFNGLARSWWPTERTWRISAALGLVASLAGYGYCRADVERRKVMAARVAPVVKGRRPDHGL